MTKIGNFDFAYIYYGLQTEYYFYDNHFDDGDAIQVNVDAMRLVDARTTLPNLAVNVDTGLYLFLIIVFEIHQNYYERF